MTDKELTTKLPGIKEEGEYILRVIDYGTKPSKAGNPMLTLLWKDDVTGNGIRTFHVASNDTAKKILTEVKTALGLPVTAKASDMLYKTALVIVKKDSPNAEGKIFTSAKKFLPVPETQTSDEPMPF